MAMQTQIVKIGFNQVFRFFNQTRCRYRLAKGSAGSGKSVDVAQDFIVKLQDMKYKGANLLVIRKIDESHRDSTYAELCSAVYRMWGEDYERYWTIRQSPMELECRLTGNKIIFRGMKDRGQREKVKSITVQKGKLCWIWIEEATELEEEDIDILDDRLRGELTDVNINLFYQITFTFNPIDEEHHLKKNFFDVENPDIFTCHSTYLDNRFIDEAYHRRMQKRKEDDPEGYRVYGLGEWGVYGGMFFNQWQTSRHICEPFAVPQGWLRFRSMDWGSYHPYAVGWYAIDYDGRAWRYRELYGYGGKANVGTKESAKEVARKIADLEKNDPKISMAVLDPACWAKKDSGSPSIAEDINSVLSQEKRTLFIPATNDRVHGWEQVKNRLKGDKLSETDQDNVPWIMVFDTCTHMKRVMPRMKHSKHNPEDMDTTLEDHIPDEFRYFCVARPWTPKAPEAKKKEDRYRKKRSSKGTDWMAM